ncbi:S5A-REDUCTASE domain-containing protein [Mycena venus]|uniref:S5A-REDUCTASE domain-containing protein n=1 Tax=Mycena venus TaxID=2733690 RepID=A0A8H6WX46_9AGAR|nr:S5A-REDUCTASE domain-containing protein [Mycena venus]
MSVLSRLVPVATSAYALQTLLALIFVPQQNETYYDLGGACGFLSTAFISPVLPCTQKQLLVSTALGIWCVRLGSFLAHRAIKAGGDSRFDEVKKDPKRFTYFWMAQATWVFLVGLPVYMVNTLPPPLHPTLGIRDYAAFGLFAASFLFEVTADRQKSAWRRAKQAKQHEEKFITSGLWSISRHPNYVGEVGIWTGIWALASGSLPLGSIAVTAAVSPLFTWFLLRKVSGVPPLEKGGDKKFGGDPKWEEYKRNVPVFWPWGSKN